MAGSQPSHEARIKMLEAALGISTNPGGFNKDDGVSLRDHLEAKIDALDRSVNERIEARDKALLVAWDSLKAKMIDENHIREQLRVQAQELVPKGEYRVEMRRLQDTLNDLATSRDIAAGKASATSVYILYAMTIASLAMGLAGLLIH